jgi:hypothetical protein
VAHPHAKLRVTLDPATRTRSSIRTQERFPWRGTVLAVHLIRFFSIALGAVTVTLT